MFIVEQMTISQCSLAAYFGTPVQLLPLVKCKDVSNVLLYFGFNDRLTKRKRQRRSKSVLHSFFESTNGNPIV